ncbi:Putative homeobox DNA-binding and leucine zipper domain family protein [Zea mays]|uniref:Putative homeobox DNA-binding and leucine zipper domain family protein n=1 Tax=Zea mays TaxID=4577 RepID=A0A1D6FM48_MAIZE|nr:Putative homeobox DNA-binding and leucine zipper domain family protein [Zea mays]
MEVPRLPQGALPSMALSRLSPQSTPRSRAHLPAIKVVTPDEDGRQSPHGGSGPSDSSGAGARKKLRLTNEQSTLLEDTFRAHNILSNAQKQELGRQVDLSARQVEVWFQNTHVQITHMFMLMLTPHSFCPLLINSEENPENHALVELFIWKVTPLLNMIEGLLLCPLTEASRGRER